MQTLMHFVAITGIMLLYYFLPVIIFYYILYVRNKTKWLPLKIQKKQPGNEQMRRELKLSLIALAIFSVAVFFMYEASMRGYTRVYFNINEYSWWYFGLSFFLNVFVNDSLFYWTHRFMHLSWVFPYIHLGHHRFKTPTPFGTLAFDPLESVLHSLTYILLIFIIPVHPIIFFAFHAYNQLANVAGHCGYELMPEKMHRHWFFNWQNTITNHDTHHKKFNCNYGNYFLIWDILMNTLDKKKTKLKKETITAATIKIEETHLCTLKSFL